MLENEFLPEGDAAPYPEGQPLEALREAMDRETICTGTVTRCDQRRALWVRFGGYEGCIPREETVHPAVSGADREIAILSRVGKQASFVITDIRDDGRSIRLSRRRAQEKAWDHLLREDMVGQVTPGTVTHLESFGAFVDLGCGVVSLLPLDRISVSRIQHPGERLRPGQRLRVLVTQVDRENYRVYLSHRELLGSWRENAAAFTPGEVVMGRVRGIREYGAFIELTPNLSGLSDPVEGLEIGDLVSVYIKAIQPEKRKIKLQVVEDLGPAAAAEPFHYRITEGRVENWVY